jgi:ABC-type antimicrobial peptide transport system permease subunit
MTMAGIGLTVSIVITMMALVNGLESTFVDTGHPNNLLVIRKGSLNEINSFFNREILQTVRFLPGVAKGEDGEPLASGEILVIINHPRVGGETSNVIVRGISDRGFTLRPEVEMIAGRRIQPGLREVMVSESLSRRFQDMKLNDTIRFGSSGWTVVGIFNSGGTAYDSEMWADYNQVAQEWDRPIYSSILLTAESAAAAAQIQQRVGDDRNINMQAISQMEYFADQTSASVGIKTLGYFIGLVMGIGAAFAAMNMMYSSVMSRSKEVATLRAIGFRARHILASFLAEAVILGLAGGAIGCVLALPMHGISTGTSNFQTFSEVLFNFRITPALLGRAMLFAAVVGILGGFFPARRAARVKLIQVLRD